MRRVWSGEMELGNEENLERNQSTGEIATMAVPISQLFFSFPFAKKNSRASFRGCNQRRRKSQRTGAPLTLPVDAKHAGAPGGLDMGITRSMAGELAGSRGMAREIFESKVNQLQQAPRGEEMVEEQE